MKTSYLLFLALFIFSLNVNSQIGAEFTSPTTGTLSGVPFEFSNFSNVTVPPGGSVMADLSGGGFSGAPLSNSQIMFTIIDVTSWTVTFSSSIPNLRLYCKFWRTGEVEFDQQFTILSGDPNFTNPNGNILNTIEFTDGIIEFTNPITTLNLTDLTGGIIGYEALTFGLAEALSINDYGIDINRKLMLHPNPSTDFIQVSGITKTENYSIYNIIGAEIENGTISEKEKIDIQNLTNGFYFLQFEKGITLKFIKK